jgi:hypothetical protein
MNKPCKFCPCNPRLPEVHRSLLRQFIGLIKMSGGFPCHEKHPEAHALTKQAVSANGKYHITDCAGYAVWGLTHKENT